MLLICRFTGFVLVDAIPTQMQGLPCTFSSGEYNWLLQRTFTRNASIGTSYSVQCVDVLVIINDWFGMCRMFRTLKCLMTAESYQKTLFTIIIYIYWKWPNLMPPKIKVIRFFSCFFHCIDAYFLKVDSRLG